jgi:hypothetical protein
MLVKDTASGGKLRELYLLLVFPVEFVVSEKGNKVSAEEAFILTM